MPATYTAQPTAMTSHSLPQLASEVPGVLRQVSKRKQSSTHLDLDSYFDFDSFYGGVTRDSESRSRAGSSAPGLTSAGSEEDRSPSPSPTEHSFPFRDFVKDAKKQDDQFTVPQRELRPKSNLTYPELMQIDVEPGHHSPTSISADQAMMGIKNTSSSGHRIQHTTHASRGRRCGPLRNSNEVAQVRMIGACIPCRIRKVKCEESRVCTQCHNAAAKESLQDPSGLAHDKCFRALCSSDSAPFGIISHFDPKYQALPRRSETQGRLLNWPVMFTTGQASQMPLLVTVVMSSRLGPDPNQQFPEYNLCMDQAPRDMDLIKWAGQHIFHADQSFEGALDRLVYACVFNGSFLPHYHLLEKVYHMKCMYTILRQRDFFYVESGRLVMLPPPVHMRLRGIAKRALRELEVDVLGNLSKVLKKDMLKSDHDRLPIWACVFELILMYRDMLDMMVGAPRAASAMLGMATQGSTAGFHQASTMTASLLKKMIIVCEVAFGKKPPTQLATDGSPIYEAQPTQIINQFFLEMSEQRDGFCQENRHSTRDWDQRLVAMLSKSRKPCQTRARQTKRSKACQS